MYGIPFGAPSHTVPKSGWRFLTPHDAISVDDFGSTCAPVMTVFHGLSSGNGRRPPSDSPAARLRLIARIVSGAVSVVPAALHAARDNARRDRDARRCACIAERCRNPGRPHRAPRHRSRATNRASRDAARTPLDPPRRWGAARSGTQRFRYCNDFAEGADFAEKRFLFLTKALLLSCLCFVRATPPRPRNRCSP